ncbi:MAG: BatA domain-containing protein, partial [Luteimonas sp.]|nr:BatA domain-containing protein [Luteimonas sp.]
MNLVLLLPVALAALAALALPLLLHLARRQQQVPTVFAALRWLRAKPKPRRRIRFDEWLLLSIRLLLLALLAFWLARPALLGVADTTPWIVVAPG